MKKNTGKMGKTTFRDYIWALRGIRIPVLPLIAIFGASMISAYASINISLFTGNMVDAAGNVPTEKLTKYAVTFLLLGAAAAISYFASALASEKINLGLRKKLWSKIMYTSQNAYDGDSGESLVSRVTTDCDFSSKLLTTAVEILSLFVSLYIFVSQMYRLNVQLANVMLILIPISVLFGLGYAKLSFLFGQKTQIALAKTTTYLVEHTQNLNLIKTSNAQNEETKRGLACFDKQYEMQIKNGLLNAGYIAMQHFFSILSLLFPFLIGAKLVSSGAVRPGIVIAFYTISTSVGTLATNLINSVGTIRKANGALSRVIDVLKLPDEREKSGTKMEPSDQDIEFQKVSFSYGQKPVLSEISCQIPKNKVTALIGPNGSGKSTLFSLLDRLKDPESGAILFGETDVQDFDVYEWRKSFCLVAQGSPLLEGTIRENICYGCSREISEEEFLDVAKRAQVDRFVSKLPNGYETRVSVGGTNLSGGQRQCVAIARAMMNNPRYLLLDEATCSLDADSEQLVMEALKELMQGRTTVIIAHSLATIRNADHIIVLHDGKVESTGSPRQILEKTNNYLSTVAHRRCTR